MVLSPKLYTVAVGCFAALGSILFGYDLGIIGAILPSPNFRQTMGPKINDSNQEGLITSLLLLGAFFSCPSAGWFADRFGRRMAIAVGCLIFFLGGSLQSGAQNIAMMQAGRFFAGWSIGWLSFLAPLYQAEIAQSSIRGRLTTLQQFFLGIGALVASWVGYGCFQNYTDRRQWSLPLAIQILPAIPLFLFIFSFPESPRWLILKGKNDQALTNLARLHANGNEQDPLVLFEYEDIKSSMAAEHSDENPYKLLFTKPQYFRPLLLGIILQFSVQMTGVSAIQYYAPQIFAAIGFNTVQTLRFQSYNSIIALAGEFACILFVDRLGRRWPLIIVFTVLFLKAFICGTIIYALYPGTVDNSSAHYAFVMMTWVFNFFFSSCIGPISWAYPVEIFPTHLRAQGTAITSAAAWISNFMIGQVSPKAFEEIGWRYYCVFAVLSMTNALTMWALFPETKGRRLEEMEDLFKNSSWFVPSHPPRVLNAKAVEEDMREGNLKAGVITEAGHIEDVQDEEKKG